MKASQLPNHQIQTRWSAAHSSVPGNASLITNCRIVLVDLFHKANPEKQIKVYALLDDARETTFVITQVQEKLGIEGVQTSLNLSTMLGREVLEVERIDGLIVHRLDGRVQVELPKAYARESIPSRRDQIPTPEVADMWPHLQKIRDKGPVIIYHLGGVGGFWGGSLDFWENRGGDQS